MHGRMASELGFGSRWQISIYVLLIGRPTPKCISPFSLIPLQPSQPTQTTHKMHNNACSYRYFWISGPKGCNFDSTRLLEDYCCRCCCCCCRFSVFGLPSRKLLCPPLRGPSPTLLLPSAFSQPPSIKTLVPCTLSIAPPSIRVLVRRTQR